MTCKPQATNQGRSLERPSFSIPELCQLLPQLLLPWYAGHARVLPWRQSRDPYPVWLSEIMLQQTRVEAVKAYYQRFLAALPTIQALADAPEAQVLKLWEGLGYYNRARQLQKTAQIICERYSGRFPQQTEELRRLPGVGPYTAGAIASICFGLPAPAVDGNVLRLLSRFLLDERPIDLPAVKKEATVRLAAVYPQGDAASDFTQALMDLGATVCLPNGAPLCPTCPLCAHCRALAAGRQNELPRRTPKRSRRQEARTVFLLRLGDAILIRQRPARGLLAGLWELPNLSGRRSAAAALEWTESRGFAPVNLLSERQRTHIFTHIEWDMTCYEIICRRCPAGYTAATPADLRQRYALPTAFQLFLAEP